MTEMTKMFIGAGLMAAGFFAASLLGPPTSVGLSRYLDEQVSVPRRLEPLDSAKPLPAVETPATGPLDRQVEQAAHQQNPQQDDFPSFPHWDNPTAKTAPAWPAWPTESPQQAAGNSLAQSSLPQNGFLKMSPPEIRRPPTSAQTDAPSTWKTSPWSTPPSAGEPAPGEDALADHERASLSPPPLFSPVPRQNAWAAKPLMTGESSTVMPPAVSSWPPTSTEGMLASERSDPAARSSHVAPSSFPQSSTAETLLPVAGGEQEMVWHVVSDGDSLDTLAERYLKDSSRANELFELNRDVLTRPDLLPIGVELRMPVVKQQPVRVYGAQGAPAGQVHRQRQLVPLPELSDSVARQPRAHLQQPLASSPWEP